MADFQITANIDGIAAANALIMRAAFPRLTQAVSAVAQRARIDWIEGVQGAKLWQGEKQPYAASIQWRMTGPFEALVWSDYKYANEIETGRPPKDLKRMLDTSQRVRRTKDGRRFLVIPFRHKLADMPREVKREAKQMEKSSVIGQRQRAVGELTALDPRTGMTPLSGAAQKASPYLSNPTTRRAAKVPQNVYQWGSRMAPGMLGPNPKGKTDRYAGMVRMDTSSGKAKRSAWMTFRVMMEGRPGWIVPAKPGLFIARNVAQGLQGKASTVFAKAVRRDLG